MLSLLNPLLNIGSKIIDRVFPDPVDKAKAQLALIKLEQDGQFKEIETQMQAIVAEAKSSDKWTSRARPSFLYVIYIMILMSIPMGIIHATDAELARSLTIGVQSWLKAIPEPLWALFGAGYLGYVGGRSYDKKQILGGKKS